MTTFHEYTAPVTKELYKQYGQIDGTLAMRRIQSVGIEFKDGFRGKDGTVYHHMLLVMAPFTIENLPELFPGVTTQWTHRERNDNQQTAPGPYDVKMRDGKLWVDAKKITFRI